MQYDGPMIISGTSDQISFARPLEIPKQKFPQYKCCRYSFKNDPNDEFFTLLVHPGLLNEECTTMVHGILSKTTVAGF